MTRASGRHPSQYPGLTNPATGASDDFDQLEREFTGARPHLFKARGGGEDRAYHPAVSHPAGYSVAIAREQLIGHNMPRVLGEPQP